MTPSELITYINDNITSNGNNEITADVLRPVLIAMVGQINDLVGDEGDLPSGSTTVIEAINNSTSDGITIHEGINNPNLLPPASFNQGDFYNRVNGSSVTITFYQYNGIDWAEIITREEQKERNVITTITNYSVFDVDDVIIYNGSNSADVITMPDATVSEKLITLINISATTIIVSSYQDLDNSSSTIFRNNSVLKLKSNGTNWIQANNE